MSGSPSSRVRLDDVWVSFRPLGLGHRRRETRWGLRGVTLSCGPGELLGVIGANGAGKSTLLRAVAGVIKPDRGRAIVEGRVASLLDIAAGNNRQLPAWDSAVLAGVLGGIPREQIRSLLPKILETSGLAASDMDLPLYTFSAGMTLRLAFAVVACANPDVAVLDEVIAVADEKYRTFCMDRIAAMCAGGTAAFIASHDMELIEQRCSRAILLRDGLIVDDGDASRVVAAYRAEQKTAKASAL